MLRLNAPIRSRRRRPSLGKRLAILFFLVMLGGWLALAWLALPGQPTSTTFRLSPGEGVGQMVSRLKSDGFIRSERLFREALRASGKSDRLQPGTYDLSGVVSYDEIIDRLVGGQQAAHELSLTFIEGWNLRDLQQGLAKAGYPSSDRLFAVTGQPLVGFPAGDSTLSEWQADYGFLKDLPSDTSLEGYLFPDTYRLLPDASPEEVVAKMLNNFGRRLREAGLDRQLAESERTIHQVVTMASILEREVQSDSDRRLVSDLFWRRLDAGMGLQADSTVNYVTQRNVPAASAKDLEAESPYNTYKYRGLPPGPICNPSLSSISAALNPEPNDSWYFLTDREGNVHYARNFDEHKLNKARHLR